MVLPAKSIAWLSAVATFATPRPLIPTAAMPIATPRMAFLVIFMIALPDDVLRNVASVK